MKRRFVLSTCVLLVFTLVDTSKALGQPDFWMPTNGPGSGGILSIAIDSGGHIYAGSFSGGVFRSTNNGNDWTRMNTGLTDSSVHALAVNSSNYLFAGTWLPGGVFRSTDEGAHWTPVLSQSGIIDLDISSSGHIFAASVSTFPWYRDGGGVFRSTDGGESWTYAGLRTVSALGINSNGNLFASGRDTTDYSFGLFRSLDNGEHWTKIYPLQAMAFPSAFAFNGRGHIFWSGSTGFLCSTDNGDNWSPLPVSTTGYSALAINTLDHIFRATWYYGGVFRSTDNGESWTPIMTGLANSTVQSLVVNPAGLIFAGTEAGIVFRSLQPTTPVIEHPGQGTTRFLLEQNYPNPFNPSTRIGFSLPRSEFVTLAIFDILGQEITVLFEGRLPAGTHQAEWHPQGVPTGVYFYRLQAGSSVQTNKLLFLR